MRWLPLLFLAACAATPTRVPATVTLVDASRDEDALRYRFQRDGDMYVRGAQRVPVEMILRLRELARTAPAGVAELPAEIPITAETLEYGRGQIEDAIGRHALYDPWIPEELEHLVSLESVRKIALARLIDDGRDTHWSSLTVTLGDIRLTTVSEVAWAQPWEVTVGTTKRTVASLEISKIVALLADPRGYTARYLNGAHYWSHAFWSDDRVWDHAVGKPVNAFHARAATREVDGFDAVSARFKIEEASYGHYHGPGDSLLTVVTATDGGLVDGASFFNLIEDEELQHDWEDFAQRFDALTEAARKIPFFRAWKKGGPDRSLRCTIVGRRAHDESNPATFLAPVWEHAGLKGKPEFAIELYDGRDRAGTLFFSPEATGCFVDTAKEGVLADGKPADFHPTVGTYAVIAPDGTVTRRTMPPVKN